MSEGRADRGLSCGILVRNGLRLVLRRWHGLDALKVACYVFQSRPGRIQKMSQSGPANAVPTLLRSECAYLEARSSSVASVSRKSWAATDKELRLASRRSWSTPSCALPVPCQYNAAWELFARPSWMHLQVNTNQRRCSSTSRRE